MDGREHITPLVGESHATALGALSRFVDNPAGRVFLVTGPAGSGKSRVLNELAAFCASAESPWFALRMDLLDGQDADVAAAGWLRAMVVEPFGIRGRRVRWRQILAGIPELDRREIFVSDSSRSSRDKLIDALRLVAARFSPEERLVLLVDSFGDRITDPDAEFFERLLSDCPGRVAVVVACGDPDGPALRRLPAATNGRRVELRNLSDAEVDELFRSDPALARLSAPVRESIRVRAGGWPLALAHFAREAAVAGAGAAPRTLAHSLAERVDALHRSLDATARAVVEALALCARPLAAGTVAALTDVDVCEARAVLISPPACWLAGPVERASGPPDFRVRHRLYAEWIVGRIGEGAAAHRRLRFARCFRRRFEADTRRTDDLVAWADLLHCAGDKRVFARGVESLVVRMHALGLNELILDVERKRLAVFRELGLVRGEAAALHNMGEVFRAWCQDDRAMAHLKRSMALFHDGGHASGEGAALANIGEIHLARGEHDRALAHFRMALDLFHTAGLEKREQAIRVKIDAVAREWTGSDRARPGI